MRRMGYNEKMPVVSRDQASPMGDYVMGSGISVNTPDGLGETVDTVYSIHTSADIYLTALDEIRTYPISQIARTRKGN